jgi:hypothetical protein
MEEQRGVIGSMRDAFMTGARSRSSSGRTATTRTRRSSKRCGPEPNVAVIDSFSIPTEGNFGGDDTLFLVEGITSDDKTFAPVAVEVADPDSASPATVTIIGVIDSSVSSLWGLYTSQSTVDAIFLRPRSPPGTLQSMTGPTPIRLPRTSKLRCFHAEHKRLRFRTSWRNRTRPAQVCSTSCRASWDSV